MPKKKPDKKVLDSTLRYLYDTLRVRGGRLVAIRFTYRGRHYEADTPQEAIRLQEILEGRDLKRSRHDSFLARKLEQERDQWDEAKFWQLMASIGKMQTLFLAALLIAGEKATGDKIAKALGLKTQESLAGVLSGLSKQLGKLQLKPSNLYLVETNWQGGKKIRYFWATGGFEAMAEEVDWPGIRLDSDELDALEKKLSG
jgi:hypothetical protein